MTDETMNRQSEEQSGEKSGARMLPDAPPVETRHELTIDGRSLSYVASAGSIPITADDGTVEARMFFVSYTVEQEEGSTPRPLSFAFNGGPGSASVWLHMGALGPKRIELNDDGTMPAPPFRVIDNPDTWLAETDLVFVDPVGTGFSRAAKEELDQKFWNAKGDIESVGEFIRLYLNQSNRWDAPLYLIGESYGTFRAAGLAGNLIDKGIAFNGIILVSAVLSMLTVRMQGDRVNDLPYCLFLPTYTATAWYHKALPEDLQARDLSDVLAEVEAWALGDYLAALARGDALAGEDREQVVSTLARYTGLNERYVDGSRLRINIMRFCKELLRDRDQTVGRLDSRFTGVDLLGVTEFPEFDPSLAGPTPPFTSAFNQHVRRNLGFETDLTFEAISMKVNEKWEFGAKGQPPETAEALRTALARNPYLKVLVACAYYDLATPYFAIRYTIDHMGIAQQLRDNVRFTTYDAGHMMYIDRIERRRLLEDVAEFIRESSGPVG
jgi:carboxypeptidase C (cathepsin A)